MTGRGKKEFIVPPESYDPSWAEDLITEKSPLSRFGPRAGWLYQMASAVPPEKANTAGMIMKPASVATSVSMKPML